MAVALLLGRSPRRLLRRETREVVPVLVVFGGVGLAEIPAILAVRRLGRRSIADLVAALPVAQTHAGRRPPLLPVGAPARESPIVGSLLLRHLRPDRA